MNEQIKDIRVIEYIDTEDETKTKWRLQVDYGSGWGNVKLRSTTSRLIFNEMQQGIN